MTLSNIKKIHINFATKVNIKAQRGAKCAHRRVGNMPRKNWIPTKTKSKTHTKGTKNKQEKPKSYKEQIKNT